MLSRLLNTFTGNSPRPYTPSSKTGPPGTGPMVGAKSRTGCPTAGCPTAGCSSPTAHRRLPHRRSPHGHHARHGTTLLVWITMVLVASGLATMVLVKSAQIITENDKGCDKPLCEQPERCKDECPPEEPVCKSNWSPFCECSASCGEGNLS